MLMKYHIYIYIYIFINTFIYHRQDGSREPRQHPERWRPGPAAGRALPGGAASGAGRISLSLYIYICIYLSLSTCIYTYIYIYIYI